MKKTHVESEEYNQRKTNLSTYNNILRNNINQAKKNYYSACFNKYKGDLRNTWKTIKEVLNKTKKKAQFPDFFKINDEKLTDKQSIADKFNTFLIEIGSKLAQQINPVHNANF